MNLLDVLHGASFLTYGALPFSPGDRALLLLTAGVLLIDVECLLPGRVLPGAGGLLLTLLGVHQLSSTSLHPLGLTIAFSGVALVALGALLSLPRMLDVCGSVLLAWGTAVLSPAPGTRVSILALASGLVLGFSTAALLRIADRARRNKVAPPHDNTALTWTGKKPE